jgi:hypothetical protein
MTKYPALLTAAMAALLGFDSEAVPHAPGVLPGTNDDPEYRMSNVECRTPERIQPEQHGAVPVVSTTNLSLPSAFDIRHSTIDIRQSTFFGLSTWEGLHSEEWREEEHRALTLMWKAA